jgi:hypothetical protein
MPVPFFFIINYLFIMIKVKINPKVQEIARSQYSMDNAAGEMHEPQRSAMAGMEEGCGCGTCEACGPSKKIIVRILSNEAVDKLHGGTADNVPKSKFNKKELSMGIDDEKEHTDDEDVASEIARDHLANDPNYYTHAKQKGLGEATLEDGSLVCEACLLETLESSLLEEAKYHGKKVTLNKPTRGDVKKFKVFVRDPSTGNIKKVNFGDKKMRIKKSNPKRRKSFRARHNCENPGPKTKARYWSCRKW